MIDHEFFFRDQAWATQIPCTTETQEAFECFFIRLIVDDKAKILSLKSLHFFL